MSKKKSITGSGLVYSTNPEINIHSEEEEAVATLPKDKQRLRVITDSKHRAGKIVTLVTGFAGNENDLQDLGKQLKTKCGTGGSIKDGEIIIQGNYKDKIIRWLKDLGYSGTK